ncbi:MAG: hypothetical protein AAGI88_15365, partial [Pseudomonadota bacterium]
MFTLAKQCSGILLSSLSRPTTVEIINVNVKRVQIFQVSVDVSSSYLDSGLLQGGREMTDRWENMPDTSEARLVRDQKRAHDWGKQVREELIKYCTCGEFTFDEAWVKLEKISKPKYEMGVPPYEGLSLEDGKASLRRLWNVLSK